MGHPSKVPSLKARLYIWFLHAFSALHCNFYYLPWLRKTKVSYKVSQHSVVNTCRNRMCKLNFKYCGLTFLFFILLIFYLNYSFLLSINSNLLPHLKLGVHHSQLGLNKCFIEPMFIYWVAELTLDIFETSTYNDIQVGASLIVKIYLYVFLFLTFSLCRWKIRIGAYNLSTNNGNVLQIVNSFVHSKYDGKSSYFDIAVLETEEIQISRRISPVCLPEKINYDANKYDNNQAELVGWGSQTKNGNPSNILKRVNVKVYSQRYALLFQ